MEIFQWLTNEQAQLENLSHNQIQTARDEIADVMIYTIRIAQVLNINLLDAIDKKIELNSKKYPIEKIEGKPSPK
jgi:NTP pyrophosphatase (non-canonical NTP hydrolase)